MCCPINELHLVIRNVVKGSIACNSQCAEGLHSREGFRNDKELQIYFVLGGYLTLKYLFYEITTACVYSCKWTLIKIKII